MRRWQPKPTNSKEGEGDSGALSSELGRQAVALGMFMNFQIFQMLLRPCSFWFSGQGECFISPSCCWIPGALPKGGPPPPLCRRVQLTRLHANAEDNNESAHRARLSESSSSVKCVPDVKVDAEAVLESRRFKSLLPVRSKRGQNKVLRGQGQCSAPGRGTQTPVAQIPASAPFHRPQKPPAFFSGSPRTRALTYLWLFHH